MKLLGFVALIVAAVVFVGFIALAQDTTMGGGGMKDTSMGGMKDTSMGGMKEMPMASEKTLFMDSKCNNCHSIKSEGVTKKKGGMKAAPDLSNAGTRHDADGIMKIATQKEKVKGKSHPFKFKGSEDSLKTLADWLASLKGMGKPMKMK